MKLIYRIIEENHKVHVVREPADTKDNEDDNEHSGNLPHLLLCSPVIVPAPGEGGVPLEPPQHSAQVAVGDWQPHQGENVGEQKKNNLMKYDIQISYFWLKNLFT